MRTGWAARSGSCTSARAGAGAVARRSAASSAAPAASRPRRAASRSGATEARARSKRTRIAAPLRDAPTVALPGTLASGRTAREPGFGEQIVRQLRLVLDVAELEPRAVAGLEVLGLDAMRRPDALDLAHVAQPHALERRAARVPVLAEPRQPPLGVDAQQDAPVAELARGALVDRRRLHHPAARAVHDLLARRLPAIVGDREARLVLHVLEGEVGAEEGAAALRHRHAARLAQARQVEPLHVVARGIALVPGEQRGALQVRGRLEEQHRAALVSDVAAERARRARPHRAALVDELHVQDARDGPAVLALVHAARDLLAVRPRAVLRARRGRRRPDRTGAV